MSPPDHRIGSHWTRGLPKQPPAPGTPLVSNQCCCTNKWVYVSSRPLKSFRGPGVYSYRAQRTRPKPGALPTGFTAQVPLSGVQWHPLVVTRGKDGRALSRPSETAGDCPLTLPLPLVLGTRPRCQPRSTTYPNITWSLSTTWHLAPPADRPQALLVRPRPSTDMSRKRTRWGSLYWWAGKWGGGPRGSQDAVDRKKPQAPLARAILQSP